MFWGLIMEPQRRYTQTVKRAFHVSMAALDETTAEDDTQVICQFDNRNYLLCTLVKGKTSQVALDLNFEVGDQISFATNGKAHVHLTGYLADDPYLTEVEEEEEEEEEDDVEKEVTTKKKRQKTSSLESPPRKKSKTLELLEAVNSNDEDDSDDSDVNMSDLMEDDTLDTTGFEEENDEELEDDEDDEGDEEEEDSDEDDVEGEESDQDSSSMSQEEEFQKVQHALENGFSSKKQKEQVQSLQKDKQQQKKNKGAKGDKTLAKTEKVQIRGDKTPGKGDKTPGKVDKTPSKVDKTPGKVDKTPGKNDKAATKSPKQEGTLLKKTVEGGVVIEDLKVGNGQVAKPGKIIKVYYEGRLKSNNKLFDSSTKGNGFEFRLGRQEVIKGWDVGVAGMKIGGKRRIICPPNMAYGQKGSPPTIPPNSTLVFDVELKNIKN